MFDTGPLRHFAAQGWIGVLRFLADGRPLYMPDTVERELWRVAHMEPAVEGLLHESWLQVHCSSDPDYLDVYAYYHDRLVVGEKNVGECGVLAMGEFYGLEIVVDDLEARTIAEERDLRVTATVPLLCEAVRRKQLTTPMVEALCDDLIEGKYFLPFSKGGFRAHVTQNGLLDWDEL